MGAPGGDALEVLVVDVARPPRDVRMFARQRCDVLAGAAARFEHVTLPAGEQPGQHGADRLVIAMKRGSVEPAVGFNPPPVLAELHHELCHRHLPHPLSCEVYRAGCYTQVTARHNPTAIAPVRRHGRIDSRIPRLLMAVTVPERDEKGIRCGRRHFRVLGRSCSRNCKRIVFRRMPLGTSVLGRRRKINREPGDLPSFVVTREVAGRELQALSSPLSKAR